eukprot:COSAG04_NODE_48_length_31217_cov_204.046758_15_plen_1201_part_00
MYKLRTEWSTGEVENAWKKADELDAELIQPFEERWKEKKRARESGTDDPAPTASSSTPARTSTPPAPTTSEELERPVDADAAPAPAPAPAPAAAQADPLEGDEEETQEQVEEKEDQQSGDDSHDESLDESGGTEETERPDRSSDEDSTLLSSSMEDAQRLHAAGCCPTSCCPRARLVPSLMPPQDLAALAALRISEDLRVEGWFAPSDYGEDGCWEQGVVARIGVAAGGKQRALFVAYPVEGRWTEWTTRPILLDGSSRGWRTGWSREVPLGLDEAEAVAAEEAAEEDDEEEEQQQQQEEEEELRLPRLRSARAGPLARAEGRVDSDGTKDETEPEQVETLAAVEDEEQDEPSDREWAGDGPGQTRLQAREHGAVARAARKRRPSSADEEVEAAGVGEQAPATPVTWVVRGRRPAELWAGRAVEPALVRRLARQAGVTESAQSLIRRARREKDDEDCEEEGSAEERPTPQPRKRRRRASEPEPKPMRSGHVPKPTAKAAAVAEAAPRAEEAEGSAHEGLHTDERGDRSDDESPNQAGEQSLDDEDDDGLSAYERERLNNIARNEEQLRALDLGSQTIGAAAAAASPSARTPRQRTKRRRQQQAPARSSFRLRGAAAPDYTGVRVIGREGGAATIGEPEMEAEEQRVEKVEQQEEEDKDGDYEESDHEEQDGSEDGDSGDPSAMFSVGEIIEAQDTAKTGWYSAKVLGLTEAGVKIHYVGWRARFDEAIPLDSGRLRREGEGSDDDSDDDSDDEDGSEGEDKNKDGDEEESEESEEEGESEDSEELEESEESEEEESDCEEEPRPRKRRRAASEYVGVTRSKSGRKWEASISHGGKIQHLGSFGEEEAAARAFDAAARRLRGDQAHGGRGDSTQQTNAWRLNFPTDEEAAAFDSAAAEAAAKAKASEAVVVQRKAAGHKASSFVGVYKAKAGKWKASIEHEGKRQHLGTFGDEEAAARAFDAAARRLRGDQAHGGRVAKTGSFGRLNFPTEEEEAEVAAEDPAEVAAKASEAAVAARKAAGQPSSPFPGVAWSKGTRKWLARLCIGGGKMQNLGSFAKEEDAAAAAKAAGAVERKPSSAHKGVTWNKAAGKWVVQIGIGGKQKRLGSFEDEAAAAEAYEKVRADPSQLAAVVAAAKAAAPKPKRKGSSAHRGVTWIKAAGKWQAQIGIGGGRSKYLGRFEDEAEAAAAYQSAAAERDASNA